MSKFEQLETGFQPACMTNTALRVIFFLHLIHLCYSQEIFVTNTPGIGNCSQTDCGTQACPCLGLQNAFAKAELNQNVTEPITLYLLPGNYSGDQNTNIDVTVPIILMYVHTDCDLLPK